MTTRIAVEPLKLVAEVLVAVFCPTCGEKFSLISAAPESAEAKRCDSFYEHPETGCKYGGRKFYAPSMALLEMLEFEER